MVERHEDRRPVEESPIPDDVPVGPSVEKVWWQEQDGDGGSWWGTDNHGEFRLPTGASEPQFEDDIGYDACNCVVKYTFERFGERRYCTGYPVGDTCKHHRGRATKEFMKQQASKFKTGATAASHKSIFRYMDAHKKIVANDLYKSLLNESTYDFKLEDTELDVDATDASFVPDEVDTLVLSHPIPDDHEMRAKALWYAALDFVQMESIKEEQFRTAFEQERDPEIPTSTMAVGERWQTVASGENGPVKDKGEHHLNLPISRVYKDYERNLTFGGVSVEDPDEDATDMSAQEWHITVTDSEDEVVHETAAMHPDDDSPLEEVTPDE